ncbi:MAG: formyltransferase family protein [Candidatus Peribacteraceae bacterium]|nr:formyltransferase family protein [Candidatus Peribacteraceae bacterium]
MTTVVMSELPRRQKAHNEGHGAIASNAIRIFFVGLHYQTFLTLHVENDFVLKGVNYIDCFYRRTINPINWLFILAYELHAHGTCRWLSLLSLKLWNLLDSFSDPSYVRYKDYINIICSEGIQVIDCEDEILCKNFIKHAQVDLCVVDTWGMLSNKIIDYPRFGTINLHPSALPKYKGAIPELWALKNKDTQSALTFMILNAQMDGGNIIEQIPFPIDPHDSPIDISNKINAITDLNLSRVIRQYVQGDIVPKPQVGCGSKTAKYDAYQLIDFIAESAKDICDKVVAYPSGEPWAYCYFAMNGHKYYLCHCDLISSPAPLLPGQCKRNGFDVFFGTKNGILQVVLFRDIGFNDSIKLMFEIKNNT